MCEEELEEEIVPYSIDEIRAEGLKNRRIILNDFIDDKVIDNIWMQLEILTMKDDESPIEICINSNGGSAYETMFLTDYIRSGNKPLIITRGMACCQSAGFLLLISGHYRICYRNTLLLLHSMSCPNEETDITTLKSYTNKLEEIEEASYMLASEQSNLSVEHVKNKVAIYKDWYISPTDALTFGFVDEIILPKYTFRDRNKLPMGEKESG